MNYYTVLTWNTDGDDWISTIHLLSNEHSAELVAAQIDRMTAEEAEIVKQYLEQKYSNHIFMIRQAATRVAHLSKQILTDAGTHKAIRKIG